MRYTATQYAKTLWEITEGKSENEIQESISGFLRILIKNGDMKLKNAVMKRFSEIYNMKNGIVEAEVISKEKINDQTVEKLTEMLKEKYGAKEVVIKSRIDESVKGGIIIRVGDDLMDGSIRKQLDKLKSKLIA